MPDAPVAFFSYSREDSEFALRLANDLRAAGSAVWIDQLDIGPGERWDRVVQSALENCPSVLVILSPASVNSNNVLDEVSFALDQNKSLIPVLYRECDIPFRLRRFQHLDFRGDYDRMLQELRKCLHIGQQPAAEHAAPAAPVQTSASSNRPAPSEVQRVTPPPAVPARPPEPQTFGSSNSTRSSVIPAWAKYGIPAAIIVIAVVVYLLMGSNPKKHEENNNNPRSQPCGAGNRRADGNGSVQCS